MSNIGNKIMSGYFATPLVEGSYIKELLEVKGDCSFLDPTAGTGEILQYLSTGLSDEYEITSYGVEIDKGRAMEANGLLDYCINAPIESMVISNKQFSLVWLNPPYDHTIKGMGDEQSERKELLELQRNTRYLKDGGIMVFTIPSYRFADKSIARYLSSHFEKPGIMRFSDENYDDFRQCVFIGRKKSEFKSKNAMNKKLYDFLLTLDMEENVRNKVTPLNVMVGKNKWEVPQGTNSIKTFYSRVEDKTMYYEGLSSNSGFQAFIERTKPRSLELGGSPILPINQGQMALVLSSGLINGIVGEKEKLHVVQGLELVSKEVSEEKGENGTTTRIRTKRQISVKLISPSGNIKKLV